MADTTEYPDYMREQDEMLYNEINNKHADKIFYCNLVVGAPGSGKTHYCHAMKEFMSQIGRDVVIINFDPANDAIKENHDNNTSSSSSLASKTIKHPVLFSITDLITVDDVMEQFQLGPNGALLYCMEWLEDHLDEIYVQIMEKLDMYHPNCRYILFDFPGQIELYTNITSVQNILQVMTQKWKFRCCVVHLTDSLLCQDPSHYISSLLVSLTTMLHLQMPHVNVLTKVDLFQNQWDQQMSAAQQQQHNTSSSFTNGGNPLLMPLDAYDGIDHLRFLLTHIDQEYRLPVQDEEEEQRRLQKDLARLKRQPIRHGATDFDIDDDDFYDDDESSNDGESDNDDDDYLAEMEEEYDEDGNFIEDNVINPKTGVSRKVKKYLTNYKKINKSIVSLLNDYSMVQLTHLSINDKYLMNNLLNLVDKAVGYTFKDVDLSTMQFTSNATDMLKQFKMAEDVVQQRKR